MHIQVRQCTKDRTNETIIHEEEVSTIQEMSRRVQELWEEYPHYGIHTPIIFVDGICSIYFRRLFYEGNHIGEGKYFF